MMGRYSLSGASSEGSRMGQLCLPCATPDPRQERALPCRSSGDVGAAEGKETLCHLVR